MAMKMYSGFQWLLIDAANAFGLDKLLFEERIQWGMDNLAELEMVTNQAETKPLYVKAVLAIRKAQAGIPTGHLVAVDGVCSGVQVMSALTGCIAGATSTGMVNPDVRADAYSYTTQAMNQILGGAFTVPRKDAKAALMTTMYGSKKVPKDLFGEDTPELNAFYQAAQQVAPGAWELLQDLLASWQSYALQHAWKLPDGFDAIVKVMQKQELRIEVDELDHATFSYEYYENKGTKKGLSNAANVVHSVDGYILRSMHRRCNYDSEMVSNAADVIAIELNKRKLGVNTLSVATGKVAYYMEQFSRSTVADVVILPYLDSTSVQALSQKHLESLDRIVQGMLQYHPFELVTIHDAFASHANNVNWVRWQYKEIMAEIAESNLLDDLLSQVFKAPGKFTKLSDNLGQLIRQSNYALC